MEFQIGELSEEHQKYSRNTDTQTQTQTHTHTHTHTHTQQACTQKNRKDT